MSYIPIKDLKQTRMVRERLDKERELVVTKDGQPFALMIGISPDTVEESLVEVRRALFSSAVSRIRQRSRRLSPEDSDIANEIAQSRRERGAR